MTSQGSLPTLDILRFCDLLKRGKTLQYISPHFIILISSKNSVTMYFKTKFDTGNLTKLVLKRTQSVKHFSTSNVEAFFS